MKNCGLRKAIVCVVSLAVVLGMLLAAGPAYGAAPVWQWLNPLPQGNTLNAVWGSAADNIYAVGARGTIIHYDGSAWSQVFAGATADLKAVWGSSAKDVFAVGASGIIYHYDGSGWSAMSAVNASDLKAVWGSSAQDVFAVGAGGNIIHYNGSRWDLMTSGVRLTCAASGVARLPMSSR